MRRSRSWTFITFKKLSKDADMKAEEVFRNKDGQTGELTHKLRTVTDLIRHIKTKEESSPANYSIFLGAGASVTSGIRTAGQLTDEWANELYERFKREKSLDPTVAKSYFEKEHPSWYNSDNPYSSLFEKKFDLPTQRRRFVEQEVDGKLPSIGYSYLVSLVDNNYFNTLFTTNFDDLLNEAFYVFSNKRPILCAHDSSIRSVSITSKRPKIVKLHGDYLFDDIKSTLRETESLEQNTKEKFVEFCKEYGLIVVGYSGSDRSIMDVLEFLVKQESYLKNGIYWCLRPGDEVCHNLRNLIWKDKVYPVLIDGFDELFAEVHSQTIGKELNLNSSSKHSKLEMTIRQIVDDRNDLKRNSIISRELESIKEDGDSKDISGFIKKLSQSDESSRLGISDVRNLLEVEALTESNELSQAIEICNTYYLSASTPVERKIYVSKFIDIYMKLGEDQKASYWCDKLIEFDVNNIGYHLKKALSIKNLNDRSAFYENLILKYPYSTALRNSAAQILIRRIRQGKDDMEILSVEARKHLDKSLVIDPSLDNAAWEKKLSLITFLYHQCSNKQQKDDLKNEAAELVKVARVRHPEHQQTLDMLESQLEISCVKSDLTGLIEFFLELIKKSSIHKQKNINSVIVKTFGHVYGVEDNKDLKQEIHKYFTSNSFDSAPSVDVSIAKIRYLVTVAEDVDSAEKELATVLSQKEIGMHVGEILNLPLDFGSNELAILQEKLESDKDDLLLNYYFETLSEIYARRLDFEKADQYIEMAYSEGTTLERYLTKCSFIALKSSNSHKIISLASSHKEQIQKINSEAFVINLQAAAKKINHAIFNEITLRNLIVNSGSTDVKICAYSLLNQHNDAKRLMRKQLEMDPGLIATYRDWPALSAECFPEEILSKVAVA